MPFGDEDQSLKDNFFLELIILSVIGCFGIFFIIQPDKAFSLATYLSNADLAYRSYNVFTITIMFAMCNYGIWKYYHLSNSKNPKGIALSIIVGLFTTAFYYLLLDESSNLLYTLTRSNVLSSLTLLIQIPDKYFRWLVLIPFCTIYVYLYARKYINFKAMLIVLATVIGIDLVTITLNIFDFRLSTYPEKTWIYISVFIPLWIFQGIGYYFVWHKNLSTQDYPRISIIPET